MVNKFQMAFVFALLGLLNGTQAQTWSLSMTPSTTPVTCSSFECGKDSYFPTTASCSVLKTDKLDEYYVRECSSGYYCPFSLGGAADCSQINSVTSRRLPGDLCVNPTDCISLTATSTDAGTCTGNVCQGVAVGQTCVTSSQCTGNSFCDSTTNVCTAPLALGATCTAGEQCGVYAVCYFENSTAAGVCATAYSKPAGTTVYPCTSSNSMACSSGVCYQANPTDTSGVCQDKLKVQSDSTCTTGAQCFTNNTTAGVPLYSTCGCAQNQDKEAYCSRGPGNKESEDYFTFLSQWLAPGSVAARCNITTRFSSYCMQAQLDTETYEQYSYDMFKASHYELYVNTKDCLLRAGYPQFYKEIVNDYDDDDDFAGKLVTAVSMMLMLLW